MAWAGSLQAIQRKHGKFPAHDSRCQVKILDKKSSSISYNHESTQTNSR